MAITVQEAQVIFSAEGLGQVQTKAGQAGKALDRTTSAAGMMVNKLRGIPSALSGVSTAISSVRNSALSSVSSAISGISGAASGMGGMLAAMGAAAAASKIMSLAAGAEQTAIAFEVLLGSAEKSKSMLEAMRTLDMKTVFGMRDLSDAAKMMLNFGVAGEEVVPVLSMITDIAAGDSVKLEGLTRAFGQVSGAGRLMGQDLNQMIQNGFSPLETISKTTGESMASLKQRMEDGKISIDEVRQSFVWATTGAGRFAGMNDRMSQTTAGQFAKLSSEVELLATAIGTTLLPEANQLLEWARKFFERTKEIPSAFDSMQNSTKDWFAETQERFEGVGVIVGVTAVHISTQFQNAFDDIVSVARAAFDWIEANSGKMADNLGARMRAMKQMLMGEEVTEFTVPLGKFQMPELKSGQGPSLFEQIDEELATARKIKVEKIVSENEANKPTKKGVDETKVDPDKRLPKTFQQTAVDTEAKSRTFSAEALFASLRESTLNKQLLVANKALGVHEQQLDIQEKQLNAINKLDMGLA